MSEWQPIETAPRDRRFILVSMADGDRRWVAVIAAGMKTPIWPSPKGEPTHWMPLPEPPK